MSARRSNRSTRIAVPAGLWFLDGTSRALAQESGASTATERTKASQNPVSDLVNIPFQFNFFSGDDLGDRTFYALNLQPVFPRALGNRWTLVARTIAPYVGSPLGRRPMSIAIQYYHYVARPSGAGADQLKLVSSFLFPKTAQ
jgi:hypothetical protein